ncbi:hypothetical protein BU23DRAFT_567379 [Bimuria novae-zelandiae CBS 107.79]|uniref:Uncharacterized protein n=1 Tax=Bimuria novae-zelandiae CBS 107.79 TaxID=1447943 RepID=A0A6A5VAV6_9PLEO|nr:hypothetical protein BU23DRAFT_567379 [Bimuria novae-zelandiae CBS 107.79]
MAVSEAKPFRLLDLPLDLRLMVYERASVPQSSEGKLEPVITLVTKSVPVSLLATCHAIYEEARSIFQHELDVLRHEPTRLIVRHRKIRPAMLWFLKLTDSSKYSNGPSFLSSYHNWHAAASTSAEPLERTVTLSITFQSFLEEEGSHPVMPPNDILAICELLDEELCQNLKAATGAANGGPRAWYTMVFVIPNGVLGQSGEMFYIPHHPNVELEWFIPQQDG